MAALTRLLTSPKGDPPDGYRLTGTLLQIGATLLPARLPVAMMVEVCRLLPTGGLAEVVGIEGDDVLLSLYVATDCLSYGQPVRPLRRLAPVGSGLLGLVIDGLSRALDDRLDPEGPWRDLDALPPPLSRQRIAGPLLTGIRAIDGMLTCGEGQRIGILPPQAAARARCYRCLARARTVTSQSWRSLANAGRRSQAALRQRLSGYRDVELLMRVGEFQRDDDPLADQAVDAYPAICAFFYNNGRRRHATSMLCCGSLCG